MSAPQSPYGNAGDALDFALDHIADPFERTSAIAYRKNRYGEQYICRAAEGGIRIWRTG